MATKKMVNKTTKTKKRVSKNISQGQVHIKTSFNNTIVTFTDCAGNVLSWCSSGKLGLKGKALLLLLNLVLKMLQKLLKNMVSKVLKFSLKVQEADVNLQFVHLQTVSLM